ncbi:maestro heat-like repeat-containing protein family member 6 [Tiliqua scincoides]|uniref:maestro heat-like repeat-containing protein family member 6 n=1 Tax=Tiliqua scincoides TaxID=71010 RepID=UPI003462514B
MVRKEKIRRTYGSHVGLNMSFNREPDFLSLNKATQTYFDNGTDELAPEKRANSYTSKEKYYLLNTKTKLVRERALPAIAGSEPGDFFPIENWKKEDTEKKLEHHESIALPSDLKVLSEMPEKVDATASVTGQILLAVASLRDSDKTSIEAAATMLTSILKKERNKLRGKVPEIIDIIYFHLRAIQEPSAREAAIGAVCLLAERHTEETIASLLKLSLFCDRHITQIWEALGQAKQPVRLQVLAKLLEALKRRPVLRSETPGSETKCKDNSSLLPLAATRALCIIFRDKKCKVPMNSFYVSVIIFLVIQLHYLMNFSDKDIGQEDMLQTSSYISCAMEALKALVKREKTSQTCFTSLAGSWDLLSSPENYIEGVLLLARAIIKHHRGLDYAVFTKVLPLLHHGDDKQKLTAMAFFTALLSSESTYTVLQKHYILGLLKNWQNDSNSTYRWLSLQGMGNVAGHLQTKKELTALILGILPSFYDPDEKVTLTALEVITKIVGHHKNSVTTYAKIAKELQPLLADERNKICCAANRLFQDLLKNPDVKEKSLMQDQVLTSLIPLLLTLQDQHPEVAKNRRESLKECKDYMGWTTSENLDSWNLICKHLVKEHRGKLQSLLCQAQDYSESSRTSSRIAAAMFIDSIFQHMESSLVPKSEVNHLKQAFSSFPSEKLHPVPIVPEPEREHRYCPDLFRCSRYFPRWRGGGGGSGGGGGGGGGGGSMARQFSPGSSLQLRQE